MQEKVVGLVLPKFTCVDVGKNQNQMKKSISKFILSLSNSIQNLEQPLHNNFQRAFHIHLDVISSRLELIINSINDLKKQNFEWRISIIKNSR